MRLTNGMILDGNFTLAPRDIVVQGERIAALPPWEKGTQGDIVDLSGKLVVPGFIDQHIHGCGGFDVEDGSLEAIRAMSQELARNGVTSFCPTVMSGPLDKLPGIIDAVRGSEKQGLLGAYPHGVRLEGPYLSPTKKGAQKEDYLRNPSADEFLSLWDRCPGWIKMVDLAPELEGAADFIRQVSRKCAVSLGHTSVTYQGALEAFRLGASQATHLFNGMAALNHREPGLAGAVLDHPQARGELICDGVHIHPAVVRLAFRLLGEDRAVVVSDSMRGAGMPDGEYTLGGQKVRVQRGKALLENGAIAGSVTNLHQELRNLLEYGVPMKEAIKAMTINPAVQLGVAEDTGSIEEGKYADLVVLDRNYDIYMVMVKGTIIEKHGKKAALED